MYSVIPLPKEKWRGFPLPVNIDSDMYYDTVIGAAPGRFSAEFVLKPAVPPIETRAENYDYPDSLYQPHWADAEAYGVLTDGELIGAIEVCPESWSNRLMVTELWVREDWRKKGVGKALMDRAKEICEIRNHRAVILETQTCNVNAIGFYLHEGFELIGFDSCCYTNADLKRREVRLDLGWYPERWRGVEKRK